MKPEDIEQLRAKAAEEGRFTQQEARDLLAEVLRLREALEFYADPYEVAQLKCTNGHDRCAGGSFSGCPYCVYTVDIPEYYEDLDFGARARAALNGDAP